MTHVEILANIFWHCVKNAMNAERWERVRTGLAHPDDCCDANQCMLDAFEMMHGRQMVMQSDVDESGASQTQCDSDFKLTDEAYDLALNKQERQA